MSEAAVGDMAVEVEPSCQCSVKFCCRASDDSRGAIWQNGVWHESAYEAKVCNWIPPCGKKLHPMTFIDTCWMFKETKQWMLAQWGSEWRASAVVTATWKTSHVLDGHAQLSHHEMKSISISSSTRISRLRLGNWVQSWISASMRWKWWWQHWNITKCAPGGPHECSHRNTKNTVCKFVWTYWINTRLRWQFPGSHNHRWRDVVSPLRAGVKMAVHVVATCEFPIEVKVQDAAVSG